MIKDTKGSHSPEVACLLTLAGGILDAYTYVQRGGVFANAQTGNTVKLGIYIAQGRAEECLLLIVPITAFILGTVAATILAEINERRHLHFRYRGILILEILVIILSSFMPRTETADLICNSLISFACALQTQTFTRFAGQVVATTVSTGNLRKAIEHLSNGCIKKDREKISYSLFYFLIVFLFIFGGLSGTLLSTVFGNHAVLFALLPLLVSIAIITLRYQHAL